MDDAHKELVKRLRNPALVATRVECADAIEALRSEGESLKQAVEAEKDEQARIEFRLNEVTAERDRLKAALQVIASDPTHSGQAMVARKALGGDA